MGLGIGTQIDQVHRLGKKSRNKPRDLVVKFKSKENRDAFYKNRKLTAPSKNPEENIYISERITDYKKVSSSKLGSCTRQNE